MDFKSNFMIFNGVYMSTSEVREKYYNAFHYNLVTVLIPKENGEYDLYPRLNFGAKKMINILNNKDMLIVFVK